MENIFVRYIRVTRGKVIVWGVFLFPVVFILSVFQRTTPLWIQQWVYTSSVYLERAIPSPLPKGQDILTPPNVDFLELMLSYFFLSYLWACIIVENFGILVRPRRQAPRVQKKRSIGKHR